MAYNAGVTNNVSNVANVSPKIIVAAIPPNAISNNNGTIPKIVVVAAISTGLVLVWGIERSGFFNGREKWAKDFENQRV